MLKGGQLVKRCRQHHHNLIGQARGAIATPAKVAILQAMTTSANNEGQDEIVNNLAASTSRLHQLKLEHDPATPDVISSASEGEEGDDPGVYVVAQGSHKDASTVETAGGQRREPFASTSAYLPATGPVVHADASAIQSSDPASQPQSEAGTSRNGEETFIFGASTRLGGRILYEGRDPWTHNAW